MNVVDSSAWLEYFADGPNAGEFAEVIFETERLIVPSITLFEVFKRIRGQRDLDSALYAVAQMQRGTVVDLDTNLAIAAAELSAESGLPMADRCHPGHCAQPRCDALDAGLRFRGNG